MAKDRKKLQHIHSSVPDKQPTPSTLEVGEIAVNNFKDQEFLSIKNSDDKVVRFSSDEQIVTITEKKEVMPYKGYVRGAEGPSSTSAETPTADEYGSYGITNQDLIDNKSNIVVKLNQVIAGNTAKHDKVNGAKDAYNLLVNPTSDGGLTDGAGFFIDMSRYAMQNANPQFSSTTNTCRTTMNGTTIIKGLDGDCGSLLDIDVLNANTVIGTATTEVTNLDNTIGTSNVSISGDSTLEIDGDTTETIHGDAVKTNDGTTVENYGDKLSINAASGVEITSCEEFTINTNNYKLKQCADGTGGKAEFDFCNGYEINTDNMLISTCTDNGKITIIEKDAIINAGDTTINDSGDTTIITSGKTIIHSEDSIEITSKDNIIEESTEKDIILTANKDICATAGENAYLYGVNETNIGTNCDKSSVSDVTNIQGDIINNIANNFNISGDTVINGDLDINGDTYADGKVEITDLLTILSGVNKTLSWTYGDVKSENSDSTNFKDDKSFVIPKCASDINRAKFKITYGATSDKSGDVTYDPGDNCTNTVSQEINIPTCVADINRAKFKITYGTTSDKSGDVTYDPGDNCTNTVSQEINVPTCASDINRAKFKVTYGATSDKSGDVTYDPGDNCTNTVSQEINVPTCVADLNRATLGYSYGDVHDKVGTAGTYDPGDNCTNEDSDSIIIPTCIENLTNWREGCFSIANNVCISGDVTAEGSFYSTSDERKKENIDFIPKDIRNKVINVPLKTFNYKEDATKRKLYGIIAQDVEAAGLHELVHIDEQGIKAVDYTSFLTLRISYLENMISQLHRKIVQLEEKIDNK